MEKFSIFSYVNALSFILIFLCMFANFPLKANECVCEFCSPEKEITNYAELGEYEEIYREFERQLDAEDQYVAQGICKNLKRWFKKRIVKTLKKFVNPSIINNPEYCAYTVAKFKRKMNKVHSKIDIEDTLAQFPDDPKLTGLNKFKERIRHYYYNKHAKPPRHPDCDRYNFKMGLDDLEDIPPKALFGGVEFACGTIIAFIPFPGCAWLGSVLAGHGMTLIIEAYITEYEKNQKTNMKAGSELPQWLRTITDLNHQTSTFGFLEGGRLLQQPF